MSGARIKRRVIYAAEIQNNHYLSVHIKKLTKKMRTRVRECVRECKFERERTREEKEREAH